MQAAGGRRWRGSSFLGGGAGGCAAAVRSGKAGRLWALCRWRRWRWCMVIGRCGLLLSWSSGAALAVLILPGAGGGRCDLLRRWCAGVVIVAAAAQCPARAGLLIWQAGQAAGVEDGQKKKARAGGAVCAAALAFCLRWRCDLLRRVRPGAYRGRRWSAPRSGAGLLALALIRAQRFQLATFQHGTACAGGAPSGAFLPFAGGVRFST